MAEQAHHPGSTAGSDRAAGVCAALSRARRACRSILPWRLALLHLVSAGALAVSLAGCSGDPGTGPVEVKWDRDTCVRCNMVLSDPAHSAQVRYTPVDGSRSRVHLFDDIGCALLWLGQQPWRDERGVEVWVNDHRDGAWIDARTAHYVRGRITPMQYGLGAQRDPAAGALDFARAIEHIHGVERRFNIHGGNLDHPESAVTGPPDPALPTKTED